MSMTIRAVPGEGGPPSTIIIDQTGPDTGTIDLDGTKYEVYDVKASADGKKLVCKTDYSIFITITLTLTGELIASDPVRHERELPGADVGGCTTQTIVLLE